MNHENFNEVLEAQIEHMRSTLSSKGKEYSTDDDKLHNFKRAGRIDNITPTRALNGMLLKHYTSYQDMLDKIDKGILPSIETLNEKIGDIINYFILFKALVIELKDEEKQKNLAKVVEYLNQEHVEPPY